MITNVLNASKLLLRSNMISVINRWSRKLLQPHVIGLYIRQRMLSGRQMRAALSPLLCLINLIAIFNFLIDLDVVQV